MIIVTDSIKDTNKILRRDSAVHSNFGSEAITAAGLAWPVLISAKAASGPVQLKMINQNTAAAIVLELIMDGTATLSFVPRSCICLATAHEILDNMNLLRCNDYKPSTDARVVELENFITKYEERLKRQDLYDTPLVLKETMALLAGGEAECAGQDVQTCYFGKVSMLERNFVKAYNNGQAPLEYPKPSGESVEYKFVKAYGIVNEADYVARKIISEKQALGEVEILCDSGIYAPFIDEAFTKRGLKYNFVAGKNGSGLAKIQLLKDLILWYEGGCKYKDLFPVVHNRLYCIASEGKLQRASQAYLKGISYGIGWGSDRYFDVKRSSYDVEHDPAGVKEYEINKTFREVELPALGKLAKDIAGAGTAVQALDLLLAYADAHTLPRNQENRFTKNALRNFRKSVGSVNIPFASTKDMLDFLIAELDGFSCSSSDSFDAVSINGISRAACLERKYTYVLGMSAKEFKISVAESPVLGDELRKELFGAAPCGNVTFAKDAIDDAEKILRDTFDTASGGAVITLISSSSDVMRDCSGVATSAFFEKMLEEKSGKLEEEKTYYEIMTGDVHIPKEDGWDGFDITVPEPANPLVLTFSKSSLDTLLACPLKYNYQYGLNIDQEEYKDYDPGVWLAANEIGTLVHRILQVYCEVALQGVENVSENFDRTCKEFKDAVDIASREAEERNAAPNPEVRDKEIGRCADMAAVYLAELHKELHDDKWIVVSCEKKLDKSKVMSSFKKNGIDVELHSSGSVDRIDKKKTDDGKWVYRIGDYKTGRYKDADEMQAETKQHLIYAQYVSAEYGGPVITFEYLYLNTLLEMPEGIYKTSFDEDQLKAPIVSGDASTAAGYSEQDVLFGALAEHEFLKYSSFDGEENRCRYCMYEDICLHLVK